MQPGICLQSVIPVRAEPSHRSEMVTQILFGERYQVLNTENSWSRIMIDFDGYEGWIDANQASPIDPEEYDRLSFITTDISIDLVQLLYNATAKTMIPIVIGSSLPGLTGSGFTIGKEQFQFEGTTSRARFNAPANIEEPVTPDVRELIADAMLYLNAPYLWGGRTPLGIDCSGLMQMICKLQGLNLPRDAGQQATMGEMISLHVEAEAGDLAFFDDSEGKIIHVGMFIDKHRLIHSSGQVRIDTIDHLGIFNARFGKYTHHLRLIKRIL